jgi:AraC-like DNA-binding protein
MGRNQNLQIIKSLVGNDITEDNLKFIDCFVSSKLSMFMPIGGNCGYAITPDHKHPAYMFILAYDHETEVIIEGRKIQSSPNSIFCLSPGLEHHEIQNYLPPKYCAIFIEVELFEEYLKIYTQEVVSFNGQVVNIKNNKLDQFVRNFMIESYSKHPSRETVLESIAILLTHEIIRNVIEYHSDETPGTDNMLINEAIKFINIEFEQDITIEKLSKLSELSKSHFTKLFTEEMKVSPMVYLKTIRLQNAKKMLRAKELSITQVARQCGFNSVSYFTKLFKEYFNETPKEFMQRMK